MSRKFPPKLRPHVNKTWPPKCKQEDAIAVSDPSISFVHFSIFCRNPILTLSYVRSTFYSHSPALTPTLTDPNIRIKYTPPPLIIHVICFIPLHAFSFYFLNDHYVVQHSDRFKGKYNENRQKET